MRERGADMTDAVLTSLVTAGAMVVVQIIISFKQQRINDVKNEYIIKAIKDDIKRLEDKQNKHNNLIERMYRVEDKIDAAFDRIDELKTAVKELSDK